MKSKFVTIVEDNMQKDSGHMKKAIFAAMMIAASSHVAAAQTKDDVYPNIASIPAALINPLSNVRLYEEDYISDMLRNIRSANSTHLYLEKKDIETEIKKFELREHMTATSIVMQYDLNADGAVTFEEIYEGSQIRLTGSPQVDYFRSQAEDMMKRYDTNKDGKITLKEVMTFKIEDESLAHRGKYSKMLLDLDPNHDGKLTIDELKALALKSFRTADENRDGIIDFEELVKIRAVTMPDAKTLPEVEIEKGLRKMQNEPQ